MSVLVPVLVCEGESTCDPMLLCACVPLLAGWLARGGSLEGGPLLSCQVVTQY